ncbi:cell division protein FtsX [Vaginella massiliensis]|uniref:cell division protein FtsX n=1 Tax=Vaginella massiliensis TaxID=1816680 RepID=UPI00083897D3|nr:permease-like cell division protein FtsX [Vaginella massiliensis]
MSKTNEKFEKKRLRSSNITVVISISLVLLLLGIFGLIIINAQSYAEYIKRELKLEAFFTNEYDPKAQDKTLENQANYIDSLKSQHVFVESTKYISKEEASKIAKQELGIDDTSLFEENIYPASVQITLKPDYVDPTKIDSIKSIIQANPIIDEVVNDDQLMVQVYNSIDKITFWLMAFATVFLIIVIILINNSLRLKIYAKRFSIKTMQLVGARRRFIMKPFILESALLGLIGAIIAIAMLAGLWYYFANTVNYALWNEKYGYLMLVLIGIGVIIAVMSTLLASWRYLKLKTDQLY